MEAHDQFDELTRELRRRFPVLDVRALVVRAPAGGWWLCGLDAEAQPWVTLEEWPETTDVKAIQFELKMGELDHLIRSLRDGRFTWDGGEASVPGDSGGAKPRFNYALEERRTGRIMRRHDWTAHKLWTTVNAIHQFQDYGGAINSTLRRLLSPWDGLDDLHEHFLGHRASSGWGGLGGQAQIRIPTPARLGHGTRLSSDNVRVQVDEIKGVDTSGTRLLVVIRRTDGPPLRQGFDLATSAAGESRERSAALPSNWTRVIVRLDCFGTLADTWERRQIPLASDHPRFAILARSELGREGLVRRLKEKKGRDLEEAVALAFHIAGFSPGPYGLRGSDADIVALPETDDYVIAVECTAGSTDVHAKLAKLGSRAFLLAESLALPVYPVVYCPQGADLTTPSVVQRAEAEGIALLSHDGLIDMLDQASRGARSWDLRNHLESLVPGQQSYPPKWRRPGESENGLIL